MADVQTDVSFHHARPSLFRSIHSAPLVDAIGAAQMVLGAGFKPAVVDT